MLGILVVCVVAPLLSHLALAGQDKIVVQKVIRAACDQLRHCCLLAFLGSSLEPDPPSNG